MSGGEQADRPSKGMNARAELDKLVTYFRDEGYSAFGWNGDVEGWSPAETAINAMRRLSAAPPPPALDREALVEEVAEMLRGSWRESCSELAARILSLPALERVIGGGG